jgi:hypothetical protein
MIFEPALPPDFVSGGQEALAGESDLLPSTFSSRTHYTWILGEELWETACEDDQRQGRDGSWA